MRKLHSFTCTHVWASIVLLFCALFPITSKAQQTKITDYVIFGGTSSVLPGQKAPASPGYGVIMGSSSSIQGGSVGSYKLVQSTGNFSCGTSSLKTNIYSGGTIVLANNNAVTGNITAAGSTGTVLSVGTSASLKGNIDVNGNIVIGSGTVTGQVTNPVGSTYKLNNVIINNAKGTPTLPGLPSMPAINGYSAGSANKTTGPIDPGSYGNLTPGNNCTVTLKGPGTYVFKAITSSGPNASIIYDFQNKTTGNFIIYVVGDVNLNKTQFSIINGGDATRIYTEVQGTGSTNTADKTAAFIMSNGSNGSGNVSGWLGTLWAPYAAIKIGAPNGPSMSVKGALWSGTQVNIGDGVSITYAPCVLCTPPNVDAGPDKALDFGNPTTLSGSSSTAGVTFSWKALNGGVITSSANVATITVSAAGKYVLTATSSAGCSATDTAVVTGKVNDIIGSELQAVLQTFNSGGSQSSFFEIQSDKIFIDVIVKQGEYNNVKGILTNAPWSMTNFLGEDASSFIITGLFSMSKLAALNTDPVLVPKIVYVRPYYRAFNNALVPTGKITQGDTSVRAHLVRLGYDLSGDGIKIGVLSNSFNTSAVTTSPVVNSNASQDIGNRDLPGPGNPNNAIPVTVLKESSFVRPDEGRAMLQIIHDIAPKAQLYFRTGVETANDFAAGIQELKQAGCNIIVDDITYITEPFLKDGVVAAAVAGVTAGPTGATYISSAGNFANKSIEMPFKEMAAPGGLSGKAHNFSNTGSDAFLSANLSPGQNYTLVLQWLDDIYSMGETANNGTKNDLDIYLTPNTDGTALFGFNRNNLNGDPIEFLPFKLAGTPLPPGTPPNIPTNILIINNSLSTNPARFKVVIFQGDITFNEYVTGGGSTIIGQSNAENAITVGAVRFDKVSPSYPGPLAIESFSSVGNAGSVVVVNNSEIHRNKPDLTAPDGVTTTVNMGADYNSPNDPDNNYSNFFGTSAAAPHVAGVAALIMEGKRKFLSQASVSPGELKSLLQTTAIDMGTPGFDFSTGAGFINADAAMRTFAAPDPTLIQLVVPQNTTPGPAPFTLTVTGVNLSPTSVVKLGQTQLTTHFDNSEKLTADVPAFIGDPAVTVYTPPIVTNGIDGGTSEALKFTGVPKREIVVKADNKLKKYAQNFPIFTATITVDGKTLSQLMVETGQTEQQVLQAFGLDVMTITSSANNDINSNVGTYAITPNRIFNPQNPADVRLQEIYKYTFNTGDLTIEKLKVTVTAQNFSVKYGEKLPNIAFTYALTNGSDAAGIPNVNSVLNTLQSAHQSQIAKDVNGKDILGLVNGQAVTIVNGQAIPIVNGQAVTIVNGQAVTIVNGQAIPIVNGQAVTIVNGQAASVNEIDLTQSDINNLSFQVSSQSLQNTRTINNRTLVNGQYVPSTTKVVDITQESVLDYKVNSAQTSMLSSLSNVNGRGLVDIESYTNGQAITIVNGQAVTIVNGQAVTIVNGQAVTIVNGQAVTIVNGQAIPIVNSQNRAAVVLDQNEIGQGVSQLKSLNMITGLDLGPQYVIPGSVVNNNFDVTHIAGVATILSASITITATAGQSKVYGDADPTFTYTNNGGLVAADFTGKLGRVAGENVKTYAYTLGNLSAGTNYSLTLSSVSPVATFAIKPAPLTVKADDKVIFKGDPLPAFTSTITGLKYTDNPGVSYTLSPACSGAAGVYTIIPKLKSFTNSGNYTVSYVNGKLYINPKGTGVDDVDTYLDCVEDRGVSYSPQNRRYVAHFYAKNTNSTTVYVPVGVDNKLSSTGSFDGSQQPVIFLPGTATTRFNVPFDGVSLKWELRTYEGNTKVLESATASASSRRTCTYSYTSGRSLITSTTVEKEKVSTETAGTEIIPEGQVNVFPNPAQSQATIYFKDEIINENGNTLYDVSGRSLPVRIKRRISQNSFEIDVSGLANGLYLLRVKVAGGYKTVRIIKGN